MSPELEPYNIHPATLPPVNAAPRRGNISLYPNTAPNPSRLSVNPNGVRTDIISDHGIPMRFKIPEVPARNPRRVTPGQSPVLGYCLQGGELTPEFKALDGEREDYFLPERRDVQ